jgi:hypothetical protein
MFVFRLILRYSEKLVPSCRRPLQNNTHWWSTSRCTSRIGRRLSVPLPFPSSLPLLLWPSTGSQIFCAQYTCKSSWRYNTADQYWQLHRHENLKSHTNAMHVRTWALLAKWSVNLHAYLSTNVTTMGSQCSSRDKTVCFAHVTNLRVHVKRAHKPKVSQTQWDELQSTAAGK